MIEQKSGLSGLSSTPGTSVVSVGVVGLVYGVGFGVSGVGWVDSFMLAREMAVVLLFCFLWFVFCPGLAEIKERSKNCGLTRRLSEQRTSQRIVGVSGNLCS
jgi:hypothetical protein